VFAYKYGIIRKHGGYALGLKTFEFALEFKELFLVGIENMILDILKDIFVSFLKSASF